MTALEKQKADLQEKTKRLEAFQRLATGRELLLIGLKEEVNELLAQAGQEIKYTEVEEIRRKEREIRGEDPIL